MNQILVLSVNCLGRKHIYSRVLIGGKIIIENVLNRQESNKKNQKGKREKGIKTGIEQMRGRRRRKRQKMGKGGEQKMHRKQDFQRKATERGGRRRERKGEERKGEQQTWERCMEIHGSSLCLSFLSVSCYSHQVYKLFFAPAGNSYDISALLFFIPSSCLFQCFMCGCNQRPLWTKVHKVKK